MRIRQLPLFQQLAIAVLAVCLVVFSTLVVFLSVTSDRAALAQAEGQLSQQMTAIAASIDDSLAGARETGRLQLDMYRRLLGGEVRLSDETAPSGGLPAVRVMKAGNLALNNNLELLGRVREAINADPAVMVLHDNRFVRVATLLKDKEGKPQVGVPLPANGPEEQTLKEGKSYFGVVNRSGTYYMSLFDPVFDADKRVIGAISIRVSLDSLLKRLTESVGRIKVGDTGYAFTFAPAKDFNESRMMMHPSLAGKAVGEMNSPQAADVMRRMYELRDGVFYYDWTDPKTSVSGLKIAAVATVKSTGWVMGAGSWMDEFTAETRRLRNFLTIAVVLSAVLIIAVVAWVARLRLKPVTDMVAVVQHMGDGDLRHAFPASDPGSRCETDLLNASLSRMQAGMSEMIGKIHQSASRMAEATVALNAASDQVAAGSESQSGSSASLAAAVEELSASINQVSGSAGDARQLSLDASTAALDGNRQVSEVAQEMASIDGEIRDAAAVVHELGERTALISSVVEVIKDVADQTNLLALNAAIEAARAGEAGRGFAVVADEVRKLAERTTQSAGEISGSIGSVQQEAREVVRRIQQVAERVGQGVETAQVAGEALRRIESQSREAVGAVSGIADSMREQSAASQEIARGVDNISQMAESNSQAAQNNQANAESLRVMADGLEQMVARFRT
ncbi:MAG TPA: Cache 3/Cache 2 fusion domain-containing protein [Rhodocyclaceae bacterium]|nr:Cache 3/Cache 2 fusion domain-containing protein [Rhodocyclaceae bacterium]